MNAVQFQHPAYGRMREVTEYASVAVAHNPGPMTLEGTNTWILSAPHQKGCVIVDPGPGDDAHIALLTQGKRIDLVLVTHRHQDHTDGIDALFAKSGAPVRAFLPEYCRGDGEPLRNEEIIHACGLDITVLAAPGHTADSAMFLVPGESAAAVLTGDTILGHGSTVLDATDGNLADYLDTLEKAAKIGHGLIGLPGHGPERADVAEAAREYQAHRLHRLNQIRAALDELGDDATAREVVEHVYVDVDSALWGAAEASVHAQLAYLRRRA
ncbi:MBL fold metallo-hydrolase [Hoyosella rhizosphaerae]|uniref:MBL fold metallo-hydrolase n=2 Tax=Hoyosella rhizosphaerae TaxID=1755582 RepID=A0A916XIF8_9ACTN|nr:MBL fold metallo-hydrolase [Hoyosella rhizosphaerae]MBN4925367.1 MBL fold metallo-hydrolase [Hoyosella rhizosphaerae]GGC75781.1 MBL fold metallo-hydrolase [Hoyosella rhizosphaerae]